MRIFHRFHALGSRSLLLLVGSLAACAHPGPNASSLSGGVGNGGGSSSIIFAMTDLEGDWVGQLLPTSLVRPERNFYMRVVDGAVTEAADSLGNQWLTVDSNRSLDFTTQGSMQSVFESTVFTNNLVLNAQMDDAMTLLQGTFNHLGTDGFLVEGSFVLMRSSGAGHFSSALITGLWDGFGANERAKRRNFTTTLDSAGAVVHGEIKHPVSGALIHVYSAGAGSFLYSDDAIGRLDNIVLTSDDGSILSFRYLLVDEQGTLLGGPGFDSLMGAGVVELTRSPVAPQ